MNTLIRFHLKTHTFVCVFADRNGYFDPRKRRLSKTPSKVETFEKGCLSYQYGRAKTLTS